MLGLRTVNKDRKSYNGIFQYPPVGGITTAPDWDGGKPICGNGLHFLPWGEGDGSCLDWSSSAIWQVVDDMGATDTVVFDQKAKAKSLKIIFEGNQKEATDYLLANGGFGKAVVGATVVVRDNQIAVSGDYGQSTSIYGGNSISGYCGNSISGDGGYSTSGHRGHSTSGYFGHSTSGDRGYSTSRDGGKVKSGEKGTLSIIYWDSKTNRHRIVIAYVGENGIEPNVFYELNEKHEFVKADENT